MFAKSKQIGLVSLLLVLGAMMGGCAESVGSSEPASFPSFTRTGGPLARAPLPPLASESAESVRIARSEPTVVRTADNKHGAKPLAMMH